MLDQVLLELRLVIWSVAGQHGLQVAELLDQLGRGLGADAWDAGHIVDAVAHQREHVADLLRRHAELLLEHLGAVDAAVVHRVEHVDGPSSTSCIRSLSELTMVTFQPALAAVT